MLATFFISNALLIGMAALEYGQAAKDLFINGYPFRAGIMLCAGTSSLLLIWIEK